MKNLALLILLLVSAFQYATIKNINYASEHNVLFDPDEMSSLGIDSKLVITKVPY